MTILAIILIALAFWFAMYLLGVAWRWFVRKYTDKP